VSTPNPYLYAIRRLQETAPAIATPFSDELRIALFPIALDRVNQALTEHPNIAGDNFTGPVLY
jgi:hypothetical protein